MPAAEPPPSSPSTRGALVLVVEDESVLAATLELVLRHDGFRTEHASDGHRAVALWRAADPDLVLLDLGLPGLDGTEVLKVMRRDATVPVVVLTARAEEADELHGLGLGADDYLVKPVSARRLLAHVHAVLRRATPAPKASASEVLRVGPLHVDPYRVEARVAGTAVPLTPSEFRLLAHMARAPGRAHTRDELYEAALPEGDGLERAVDVHVAHLRRKLRRAGTDGMIETVRGVGYRLGESPP